ncbi:hypothetical protein MTY_2612 [Moorella thermoacetica Y72]|uniref:Uncharacterized protein n=1 Tax=Moorella thermoacetica Y72 TaxID=1325331 RepID=A0A0S6UDW9_NEOTH|nr:hypothetical protein MTY_2612 [Moorella thermoacetica Y72]
MHLVLKKIYYKQNHGIFESLRTNLIMERYFRIVANP